jgi:sugar lactone lactonase YvrE
MRTFFISLALAAVAAACTPSGGSAVDDGMSTSSSSTTADPTTTTSYAGRSYAGTVDAPEFPGGLEWVNTPEPITMDALRGKVVLLDFWTYGCINCIHIIPDLERLEAEYPDELVVIGVHSAKFPNEARTGNLRDIVQRYGIRHAVVNDEDFTVWNAWGANAWPTVALVDPEGHVVGTRAGEGVYDAVKPVIAGLVAEFDARQAIDRDPIALEPEVDSAPGRPLSYPGKVLAADGRLWIADTGHHRIVEADPATGNVLAVYGSGRRGSDDGLPLEASFNAPQGLALGDGVLYVADTNNHLIRAVDLSSGIVSTLAGTGDQGWPPRSGQARETALSNPWALALDGDRLYIANAGTHQIWRLDFTDGILEPLIGSGAEGTGNATFGEATLAQPSGLALAQDGRLYFADSESSSIRVADLVAKETALVVGGDGSLFDFGDEDGRGNTARLQHPLGIAVTGDRLIVADTYNSKIKRVDLGTGTITTWLGGDAGWADGPDPRFNEPGGLSIDGATLYVADTNNHAVRMVDMVTGATSTLVLRGIEAFDPPSGFAGATVRLEPITAAAGPGTLLVDYRLPQGYEVNEDAPSSVVLSGGSAVVSLTDAAADLTGTELPASVPLSLTEGSGTAIFDVTVIYCAAETPDLCLIDRVRYEQPLAVGPAGASTQIVVSRTVAAPSS